MVRASEGLCGVAPGECFVEGPKEGTHRGHSL